MEPVLDYIHQQSLKAVDHEQNAKRAAPLTKFEVGSHLAASRVTACGFETCN